MKRSEFLAAGTLAALTRNWKVQPKREEIEEIPLIKQFDLVSDLPDQMNKLIESHNRLLRAMKAAGLE